MKVFQALYNPMTEESSWGTISLHMTRAGAQTAIEDHKEKQRLEWEKMYEGDELPYKFGAYEDWTVSEIEILEP